MTCAAISPAKNVVFVYHNQIDARGDEARTENEVFSACEEAVEELYKRNPPSERQCQYPPFYCDGGPRIPVQA